tara:strand:+ start:215 stop:469 length:255 start_codon:yes stop_codon:yes gene_type:complete
MMNNDHNHDARISCEETFTADMGPADWANEPTEPTEADFDEANARCEDAPCCGCCPSVNDYRQDNGCGTWADDAWHDAQEYPEW